MMSLATYQLQSACSTFPSVRHTWSTESKSKNFEPTILIGGRRGRLISLKCRSCPSVGASLVLGLKPILFKISAFKGGSRHDDSGGRTNGSNSIKNPAKVSLLQHGTEESSVESINTKNVVPAPYTPTDDTTTRMLAMQNLFKHWLLLLRTSPQTQPVDDVPEEASLTETSEAPNTVQNQDKGVILKSVWCYFLGLDATIKVPFLIFTPVYLAVNLLYGSEISKELTPLWIVGPFVVALYVKVFQMICALYVFTFKETVKVVKNLPACYLLVCDYLFHGKLKEIIRKHVWQPVEDIKTTDYNEITRRKLKDLRGWLLEKYLDYVESIWPHYCRAIRFLKRANLL